MDTARGIFSDQDLVQLARHGIDVSEAERQLACYRRPPAYVRLLRPCTVGDGIVRIDEDAQQRLAEIFDTVAGTYSVLKFVPASGAASRMFRTLLRYLNAGGPVSVASAAREDRAALELTEFLARIDDFAFSRDLACVMARDGLDLGQVARSDDVRPLLDRLLTGRGLDYAALPKALLAFHRYEDGCRTAFEEHLVEGVDTVGQAAGVVRLHFTVSPEHRPDFDRLLSVVRSRYEMEYGVRFEVGFSCQRPSTDAIAVDLENRPFRDDRGTLLLRPSGHGALLPNLAECGAEVVFIKNIDNVVPDHFRGPTIHWKKVLGGLLVELRRRIFELLDFLGGETRGGEDEALAFLDEHLHRPMPAAVMQGPAHERRAALQNMLDRPLRVCGMVVNTGEPGGGPFWVQSSEGPASLQIVELSQVAPDSESQRAIVAAATHFNPVDLVCAIRDRRGRCYDLSRYVDEEAFLIVEKSHDGKPLRSIERPGLWNGAMSGWNTVFVEVPIETFHPVKTVNDLLRPAHQPPGAP